MDRTDKAGDIPGWYSKVEPSYSSETLQGAYAHAKILLRSIIKPQDYDELFPPTEDPNAQHVAGHNMFDVQRCLWNAQNHYECRVQRTTDVFQTIAPTTTASTPSTPLKPLGKLTAKARFWLMGLSEKIVFYGNVFDVISQHHPEYVSLAWGTFKLLFIAITNHAETASKLSKSISQIADLLPQHSLHLILYPTPQMQHSVAHLYAHILNFFLSSLKWYKNSRAVHALKSIFQPWDLKFRQEYEAIAYDAQQIRQLADVAMKAELRDTRLEVERGTKHLELVKHEIHSLRVENQRWQNLFQSRFETMENSMHSIHKELRFDFATQHATLNRVHLNQMLSLPLWDALPTSGESLHFCRSMRNRRRERTSLPPPDVKRIESWASQRTNAVLLIDTYRPMTAKTFMVDLIDLILEHGSPVVWALRYADYWDRHITVMDIVRMLVLQTMQVGSDRLLSGQFPVKVEQLREAASLGDWVSILKRLLSCISHAFVTIDPDLLAHATAHERSLALEMLDLLRCELSGNFKIVLAMSSVGRAYAKELECSNVCVKIRTGDLDWRRRQRQGKRAERFRR